MKAVSTPDPGDQPRVELEALQPCYEWRLLQLMAVRKSWTTTTKLIPELRKRGFVFDRSSIYRLVKTDKPPKMSVELILALCEILECRFEDLVVRIEPADQGVSATPSGPRPVLPDGPLLSANFFDAES
ncbi:MULTISPECIES: helix-turn-helix transcriptional regulator [Amycolatopsis]|uniref:Cro/Cl family transcriptional regulator n=1 Tax=Amycolatopsis antarctica TaxID=1854586 RepID=A0A263CZB0_9PSEU|nr:helix-turn-helix transcriptional regulator [Amycolatopsis antarctica]OZM70747.1 Cro/Cl family transcriptional regulator [Amycolatopsis antarctica]